MTIPLKLSKPTSDAPRWDPNRSHIRVVLRDVEVQVSVGLHPWERHPERPTRLVVNVEMFAATEGPVDAAGTDGIMNYDIVRSAIAGWRGRPHVELLETLVEELVGVCLEMRAVQACRVSVVKPDIFNDAAAAGVEVFRVKGA
jgi:dihydroneopterin aldolase